MSAIYETDQLLSEYLLFHYGSAEEILPSERVWPAGMSEALDFAVRTPTHFSNNQVERGLDLGCAVGRSTFEMSRVCKEVIGIDFSHSFIQAAVTLSAGESVEYSRLDEASFSTRLVAKAPPSDPSQEITFLQGDAMDLPDNLGSFDRVHAANLLCRLSDPMRLLNRLPSLVNTGGELVLATPCTWLENFTPRNHWPVGRTQEWLEIQLSASFTCIKITEEPFLIRETARKFQWTHSLVTVWQRRD